MVSHGGMDIAVTIWRICGMIELRAVSGPTGRLLAELLRERGVRVGSPAQGIVSYGVSVRSGTPTLNGMAGSRNKYDEMRALHAAGVSVPEHRVARPVVGAWLGRQLHHTKGYDITYVNVPGAPNPKKMKAKHADFFVKYVPKSREFRVWVYRSQSIAAYEKLLRHPEMARFRPRSSKLVWNRRNGYAFEFIEKERRPNGLGELGVAAIKALGLDFGAVDIILGTDGRLYVLEVNTAPGTEGPRQGLTVLADKIAKWEQKGYPKRKGEAGE